jgi:tetratricopeptide (TPR) repeat protein
LRALANQAAQSRNLRLAITSFQHLVTLRPDDADAWQRLGLLLIATRQSHRGLDALSHAADLAPNDLLTQSALGNAALQAGRLDQADRAFHIVLAREPNDPHALVGLAKTTMRLDPSPAGLTAAEQETEAVLRVAPSADAYSARGQVRMTQLRLPEAINDFKASIALDPRARAPYVFLSQCYASTGRSDLARKTSAEFDRLTAAMLARDRDAGHAAKANQ